MDHTRPSSDGAQGKRKKISDEERIRRCRERNRVHARNTRERKKHQMDELRQRIEMLTKEKSKLKKNVVESSVADILVSLSTDDPLNNEVTGKRRKVTKGAATAGPSSGHGGGGGDAVSDEGSTLSEYGSDQPITVQQIRRRISAITNEEEKTKSPQGSTPMEPQLPPNADPEDIERMRRERNKLHARKTRVRKKKLMHEMERIVSNLEEEVESLRSRSRSGTLVEADAPGGVVNMEMGESSGSEMNAGANVLASSFKLKSGEESSPPPVPSSSSSSSSDSNSGGGGGRSLREKKSRGEAVAVAAAAVSTTTTTTTTSLAGPVESEAAPSSSRARSASRGSNDIDHGSQGSGSGEGSSTKASTNRTNSTTGTNGTTGEAGDTSDSKLSTSSGSSRTGHAQNLLSMSSSAGGGKTAPKKRKKGATGTEIGAPTQKDDQQLEMHNGLGEFPSMGVPKRRRVPGSSPSSRNAGGAHGAADANEGATNSSGDTSAGQGGDEGGGSGSGSGSERDFEGGAGQSRGRSRRAGRQGGPSKPFTVPSYPGAGADSMDMKVVGGGDYSKLSVESLERHNQSEQ